MNKLLILLLFVSSNMLLAQNNCAYEVDKVDKFDGNIEKITRPLIIAQHVARKRTFALRKVYAQLKNYEGEYLLALKFPMTSIIAPTFKDDEGESRVILLLDNGKKISLPLSKLMHNNKDKIELRYGTDFSFSKRDLAILKNQKITDMRVALKANTFDVPIDKTAQEQLRQAFHCVE